MSNLKEEEEKDGEMLQSSGKSLKCTKSEEDEEQRQQLEEEEEQIENVMF